jgi:hypothetical protein
LGAKERLPVGRGERVRPPHGTGTLNSVSALLVTLISSKSRVYSFKYRVPVGQSVGGIFEMDSSDWSNGIRHHIFDTRPDTEFKVLQWARECHFPWGKWVCTGATANGRPAVLRWAREHSCPWDIGEP